jgi:hypothetical protein
MENKYFTPDIEDIRVGYEYEKYIAGSGNEYEKLTFNGDLEQLQFFINCYRQNLQDGWLRVPYLTVEQIEAEGWEITFRELKPAPYKVDWINARKGDYDLWINLAIHDSMKLGIDKTKWGILYRGHCKDINTFRQIIKLLKIN